MFKGVTALLSERRGEKSGMDFEVDAATMARAFGVEPVGEPLRRTDTPITHAADDDTAILLDHSAPNPAPPRPLLSIVISRLQSLPTKTSERKAQVLEAITAISEPLRALDALVAEVEEEHFNALDARWEEVRKQGRELLDSLPALQAEMATRMQYANLSMNEKTRCKSVLESAFEERKRISRFATAAEVRAADSKLAKARVAIEEASQAALKDQQLFADAEAKVATCKANLGNATTELSRLEAELAGNAYHDPQTGLSKSPVWYRDNW